MVLIISVLQTLPSRRILPSPKMWSRIGCVRRIRCSIWVFGRSWTTPILKGSNSTPFWLRRAATPLQWALRGGWNWPRLLALLPKMVLVEAHILEHGKYQRCAHQRRNASGRTTCEAQPDCHSADAGAGGQQWKESVEMRLHATSTWMWTFSISESRNEHVWAMPSVEKVTMSGDTRGITENGTL